MKALLLVLVDITEIVLCVIVLSEINDDHDCNVSGDIFNSNVNKSSSEDEIPGGDVTYHLIWFTLL